MDFATGRDYPKLDATESGHVDCAIVGRKAKRRARKDCLSPTSMAYACVFLPSDGPAGAACSCRTYELLRPRVRIVEIKVPNLIVDGTRVPHAPL